MSETSGFTLDSLPPVLHCHIAMIGFIVCLKDVDEHGLSP
jgi:hypothetical protein